MKFIPEKSFTIITTTPAIELNNRLKNYVDAGSVYRFGTRLFHKNKDFLGNVSENEFRIRYRFRRNNVLAYPPVLYGCLETYPNGTKVFVSMKLHPFIIPFTFLYLAFLVFVFIFIILSDVPLLSLLPLVVIQFIIGCFLPHISFYYDSRRSRECLEHILTQGDAS